MVSLLLPKRLHQDFYNVYSFCRWADDLGDEIGDTAESLRLLAWWRSELQAMCAGGAKHPVFVALAGTAREFSLPVTLFDDLIKAFEQDQTVTRYRNFEELFEYCRYSANPVGRLVLGLCGYRDAERQALSDATCTALQLANFWQDVTVDLEKDRVYLPLDLLEAHGYPLEALFARQFDPRFRAAMQEAVNVTRGLFLKGLPLGGFRRPAPGHRPGTVQPRRPAGSGKNRASGLRCARVQAGHLQSRARGTAAGRTHATDIFTSCGLRQPEMTVAESYAFCERVARTQAKNFYYSFLLLSRPQRQAMCAIYAFMRYCDDLSDAEGVSDRAGAIARWQADLDSALAGNAARESGVAGVLRCGRALPHPA